MPILMDQYQRQIKYLRLSVTDRCDLRCFYCMPNGLVDYEEPDDWLSFDEIERVVKAFTLLGVSSVRLTGGEPLIRKNLPQLVQRLNTLPLLDDLSLSSNATQLEKQALALYDAGVSRINISLDTINAEKFKQITKGNVDKIINGLLKAKEVGITPIKINMVIMKGINDGDDVEEMVDFCSKHGFSLRFIETMPMGDVGRNAKQYYIELTEIEKRLSKSYQLLPTTLTGSGPARYLQVAETGLKIGFITPLSRHFCDSCNRVRLAVNGDLYLCLGDEHKFALRPLLREGITDQELANAIKQAIQLKPYKHEFIEQPDKVVRFMSKTGG